MRVSDRHLGLSAHAGGPEAGKPRSRKGGGRLTLIQVHTAQGKVDDSWIPFLHKVVLGEPLDMEDEVWR